MKIPLVAQNLFRFYRDGFKNMTVGKTLWIIALVKIFIIFFVLKLFFFPNFLNSHYSNETDKAKHVGSELIERTHSE